MGFLEESRRFQHRRAEAETKSRILAAARLAGGVDLEALHDAASIEKARIKLRLALERERQKGLRRHWSYDLNRHIALKQALNALG